MAHRSDSKYRLKIKKHLGSEIERKDSGNVYVINLPILTNHDQQLNPFAFSSKFEKFFQSLTEHDIIVFISNSETALNLIAQFNYQLKYRLWIAIERHEPF